MVDGAILVCREAGGSHWQLGPLPPPEGAFLLIGWTIEDPDGGVPARVVKAIARALVRYGRVTFPCTSMTATGTKGWQRSNDDAVSTVKLALRAVRPRDLIRSPHVTLLSTSREEAARHLFDDPFYQWWNQTQFVLLSRPAEQPPDISEEPALSGDLFELRWATAMSKLARRGVDVILRPGVDGDVIGALCSSREVRTEFEERLELAATDFDLAIRVLPEQEFASLLLTEVEHPREAR
jgi:hypothetical protein